MPRALWSGSLSFGLVNVPVQLVSAARDLDYRFHQLHDKDRVRIEQRRFCSKEDTEVLWEEVAHGYELDGKQVIVTDQELASVQPRKTRTIDIEAFVDLAEVDPIHFDYPYHLVPAGESEGTLRAYKLLVEAMGRTERVALGRFVMRRREYLVAVRVRDGALALTTMRFHDEVRSSDSIETGGKKPTKKTLDNALAIVDALSTDWDPQSYTDCYRERLKGVIDGKRKGQRIRAPKPRREPAPAPDLMSALQRTLDRIKEGGDARAAREAADSEHEQDGREELTRLDREELYRRAQEAGVPGRSNMSKAELVEALADGEEGA
jgi:DNA end-binding protein Ku